MPEPRISPRFFVRRSNLSRDSFSYGDWEQFVVRHRDGTSQCVRLSRVPFALGFAASTMAMILLPLLVISVHAGVADIAHPVVRAEIVLVILSGLAFWCFHDFPLVVAVGPRQPDGWRRFWADEE